MEHTKHIWRAGLILIALFVLFIAFRHVMIPEPYGVTGSYRHDSLQRKAMRRLRMPTIGSGTLIHSNF